MSSHPLKQVFAFVGWSSHHQRRVMSGILSYADEHAQWDLINAGRSASEVMDPLFTKTIPDGLIILDMSKQSRDELLKRYNAPVVNLFDEAYQSGVNIFIDDERVGKSVAEYFLDRRYQHFAYVGLERHQWSVLRESGYRRKLADSGYEYHCYHISTKYSDPIGHHQRMPEVDAQLVRWLADQPMPLALFAGNDVVAVLVNYACRKAKLQIPADVAIVGVDNDELWCGTMRPRLSSVSIPWRNIGYQAAKWLDRMMHGEWLDEPQIVVIEPVEIVTRQSSDFTAVGDPDLKEALVYLRQNACRPVSVNNILEIVPISRRRLERMFRKHLGHSPFSEIRRLQVEQARRLLENTELNMPQIATNSGLNPDNFSKIFHHHTGMTPREYRKRSQG